MNRERRHSDADALPVKRKGKEALLLWCQVHTAPYRISVDNFSTSWKDGLAFCALLHHFAPSAFDYHELKSENVKQNLELAFTKAEDLFDIFQILDAEDMMVEKPDGKAVVTYLASWYHQLSELTPPTTSKQRSLSFSGKSQRDETEGAMQSYEDMFEKQRQIDQQNEADKARVAKARAATKTGAGTKPQAEAFNKQNPMMAKRKANRHSITVVQNASCSAGNSMRIQQRAAQTTTFSYTQPKPKTQAELAQESTVIQGWLYKRSKLVWKKRYCMLEPKSSLLHYYVGYMQSQRGYIDVKQIASVALCPSEIFVPPNTVCFKLTTVDPPRTWVLAAAKGEKNAAWWLSQLRPDLFRNRKGGKKS